MFAQISGKLQKITKELMTGSLSNEYPSITKQNHSLLSLAQRYNFGNTPKNYFKIERTSKTEKILLHFSPLKIRTFKDLEPMRCITNISRGIMGFTKAAFLPDSSNLPQFFI